MSNCTFFLKIQFFSNEIYPIYRYKEAAVPPALWLEQSLNSFREQLLNLCQPNRTPSHPPLERSSPQHTTSSDSFTNKPSAAQAASTKQILDNLNKLMTACVVLRIENFMLYRVTTSGKKSMPKEFISGTHYYHTFFLSITVYGLIDSFLNCENQKKKNSLNIPISL